MALEQLDCLEVVWTPSADAFANSPLGRMAARHGIRDMGTLQQRASEDPNWYWGASADDLGMRWFRRYDEVLDLSDGVEFAHFFAGGRLNWADYSIDRWVDQGLGGATAIVWEGDDGERRDLSYREVKEEIDRAAGALQSLGVKVHDTVGIVLPMIPESAVALLAVAKIGAISVPMFSGYGPVAIRDRVEQSGAEVIITCDTFYRRGKRIALKATVDEAIAGLDVRHVVVVERAGESVSMRAIRDHAWKDLLDAAAPVRKAVPMNSDDPCLLLFTSGSTGRPKGCIHTHAGLPYKLAIEARHGFGLDQTGTLLWLTDMGWVMGAFVVAAAFANGATLAMFEGTPDWPSPDRLWAVASRLGATVLGVSPTLVRSLMREGAKWPQAHDLGKLKAIGSTGEPWNLDPWMWCFRHVGNESVPIVNISGGTECGGSLLSGSVLLPVKPMSFCGPTLGVATDVVDADGAPLRGDVGELVVRAPWPGMTTGLWHDSNRYLESYWQRYPGLWHQGDFAYTDPDGFWYLLGRSDDTVNVAGKRVGPAEIESIAASDPEIVEAAAVGVPDTVKGETIVLFVVIPEDSELEQLRVRLLGRFRSELGPTLVPRLVLPVRELPKTRSGKIMRRLVRAMYLGEPAGDVSSLENPGALDCIPTAVAAEHDDLVSKEEQ